MIVITFTSFLEEVGRSGGGVSNWGSNVRRGGNVWGGHDGGGERSGDGVVDHVLVVRHCVRGDISGGNHGGADNAEQSEDGGELDEEMKKDKGIRSIDLRRRNQLLLGFLVLTILANIVG